MSGPPVSQPSVSVLGLGPMGHPMANCLLRARSELTVWNRTSHRADDLVEHGARRAATPGQAAGDVVLTVLPDLPHVKSLLPGPDGLLEGWRRHDVDEPVLVVHGTVSAVAVRELARNLWDDHHVRLVDAPMSGGVPGAERGTLSLMVGGDADTVEYLTPVFAAVATTVVHLGDSGAGQLAKACNQIVVAATIAAWSEAICLADSHGLDRADLFRALAGGLAGSELLEQKRHRWLQSDYQGGGSARNQMKDLVFARDAAVNGSSSTEVIDLVLRQFSSMVEAGDGDLDHSGLLRSVAARSTGGHSRGG